MRTTRDAILAPDMQLGFAERVGRCPVVDLDAGHMCMISQPDRLAEILEGIAGQLAGRSVLLQESSPGRPGSLKSAVLQRKGFQLAAPAPAERPVAPSGESPGPVEHCILVLVYAIEVEPVTGIAILRHLQRV